MPRSALELWLDTAGVVDRRRLSGDERRTLKILVSERVRELYPYVSPAQDVIPGGRSRRDQAPEAQVANALDNCPTPKSGIPDSRPTTEDRAAIPAVQSPMGESLRRSRTGAGRRFPKWGTNASAPPTLVARVVTPVAVSADSTLSKREREVATLLLDGLSNAEIAAMLWIGVDTVKTHIKRVIQKTGAKNRPHAAAIIVREQIARMADSQERVANVG
jgi:DNA-binding CsgD family transcriptional regulator